MANGIIHLIALNPINNDEIILTLANEKRILTLRQENTRETRKLQNKQTI